MPSASAAREHTSATHGLGHPTAGAAFLPKGGVPIPSAARLRPSATMPALATKDAVEAFARAVLEELENNDGLLQRPAKNAWQPLEAPPFLEQVASGPRLAIGGTDILAAPIAGPSAAPPRASTVAALPAARLAEIAAAIPSALASHATAQITW